MSLSLNFKDRLRFLLFFTAVVVLDKAVTLCQLSGLISKVAGEEKQVTWLNFPGKPHERQRVDCESYIRNKKILLLI